MTPKERKSVTALLVTALELDPGLREAWQSNIAMAFVDAARWHCAKNGCKGKPIRWKDVPVIANQAADHFLNLLAK